MYTVENLHPAVVADIKEAAKVELDRVWELYLSRRADWEAHVGTALDKVFFDNAVECHENYQTTRNAYAALGITGSIGIHFIATKVGA